MDTFDTIIVAASPTNTPIVDRALLEKFSGNIISISRPACIDNEALLEAVNDGRITNAQMDMLDPKGRDELKATGKVDYHGHKAWEAYGITQYDERYFSMVFGEIRWLLRNDPQYNPPIRNSRVVLERKSNALFGD
jgi:phosphoglycerate dehydrogenase-like enzyme